ncbi:hypothetical protein Y032_0011g1486 [Ancylostoma ceylanicum]|nr:hypothetical protein Y032_0011g1486 [Ancylostoma ceylanicum]
MFDLDRKRKVFHSYETLRSDNSIHVHDDESVRINALTGEKVARVPQLSPNDFGAPRTLTETASSFGNLPAFLSLLQQQIAVPLTPFATGVRNGFDIRTLLRSIQLPEAAE